MKRKDFIKKSLLGGMALGLINELSARQSQNSTYDKLMDQVGFNHLPLNENRTMKSILHKAHSRGGADHGWLDTKHTFSFASYYNPERVHFGVLRVLNDDIVKGGKGFPMHPHDNMEIISIPLKGGLRHQDSMGNKHVIMKDDVQVMSAGTGIRHSEYNNHGNDEVNFLQIWLFPNKKGVQPRYDQITVDWSKQENRFNQILSPNPDDVGVWIYQNAWFHLGKFTEDRTEIYKLKSEHNGLYVFVIEGRATVGGQKLEQRDGYGIWETPEIEIKVEKDSEVLLMDVPMTI